jgi:hypothetical protein
MFHHFMKNGRTSPAIFSCEGLATGEMQDYVVKLKGGMERQEVGLLCEIYASMLASYFDITCPKPAIILLEDSLAELVAKETADPRRAQLVIDSIGLNFGTSVITNMSTWPVDKHVPAEMLTEAVKVFAFDALIQNPDRRFNNPNLATRGSELLVFDHELAFSFLQAIFSSPEPWKLDTERYLDDHVFAKHLKGESLAEDFKTRLSGLVRSILDSFSSQVPDEWQHPDLKRIEAHLRLVQEHAAEFALEVERRLA